MQVLRNKPDFRRKPWPTISNGAKDFVKKLLVKEPRARYTAAQALCKIYMSYVLQEHLEKSKCDARLGIIACLPHLWTM